MTLDATKPTEKKTAPQRLCPPGVYLTLDVANFNEKKIAVLVCGHPVPMITFCETDGRWVSLPYCLLSECVLTSDSKVLLADFGELSAVIEGEDLSDVHYMMSGHKLEKIQVFGSITSIYVGPSEEEPEAAGKPAE
jgi:hypothetical protein